MQDLSNTYAWDESLALAAAAVRACEEFSDAEHNVLVWHLRQLVVDLPAGVVADLQAKRPASRDALVKLEVVMALIKKIYPAIDLLELEDTHQTLVARMDGQFAASKPYTTDKGSELAEHEQAISVSKPVEVEPAGADDPDAETDILASTQPATLVSVPITTSK